MDILSVGCLSGTLFLIMCLKQIATTKKETEVQQAAHPSCHGYFSLTSGLIQKCISKKSIMIFFKLCTSGFLSFLYETIIRTLV